MACPDPRREAGEAIKILKSYEPRDSTESRGSRPYITL